MTLHGFLWTSVLSLLVALIGVGVATRMRWEWRACVPMILAAAVSALGVGLLRFPMSDPLPLPNFSTAARGISAAANIFFWWAVVVEAGLDSNSKLRALMVFLLSALSAMLVFAVLPISFAARPDVNWGFLGAAAAAAAAAPILWAAARIRPPHYLLQGMLFLLIAAAADILAATDKTAGHPDIFAQVYLLALAFAFFSLTVHSAQEGPSKEEEQISSELPRLLAGYLNTLRSLLKTGGDAPQAAAPGVDAVSGVHNFTSFRKTLESAMRDADVGSSRFAVVFLDIEDLSAVNDRAGFDTGDRLLRALGAALARRFGNANVGRIGGDEFAVILRGDKDSLPAQIEPLPADLRRELDSVTPVNLLSAYAIYPFDFHEQSGVFRRLRKAAAAVGAAAPIRVKSG